MGHAMAETSHPTEGETPNDDQLVDTVGNLVSTEDFPNLAFVVNEVDLLPTALPNRTHSSSARRRTLSCRRSRTRSGERSPNPLRFFRTRSG